MTASGRNPPEKSTKISHKSILTERTPVLRANNSGQIAFDDRGNAVWKWSTATDKFTKAGSTAQKIKRLMDSGLAIADDAPSPDGKTVINSSGATKGYDPYASGRLSKVERPRKKDLRKLGEWLNLRKQAKQNKEDDS